MSLIRCRVLGPVLVTVGEVPAPQALLWRKHLALLIYLLRSPRRMRSREHLVGLLWADRPEHAARHSLNEALRVLRRAAGEAGVESVGDQVRLGEQFSLDVDDFERAVARGDWGTAAALCGGEFAEGLVVQGAVDFDQWLEEERRHFRAQGVLALSSHAERLLDQGRTREAQEVARRALALDRLADRAVMAMVRSHLVMGDVRGAMESGQEYLALCAELGVPASHAVSALLERELPATQGVRHWTSRQAGLPFVGRERELSLLREACDAACARRQTALVVVSGEPGMGVSRLLAELATRARLDGAVVVRVAGVAADRDAPWSGTVGLAAGGLLAARGLPAAPSAALGTFAERLQEWRERFPSASDDRHTPGEALADVVAVAADEAPILFVLDDAHRLDAETLRAVPLWLRRWTGLPVMVALGASSLDERNEVDELRRMAGRDLPGLSLELGPLSIRSIRALAASQLPSFTDIQLDRLVRRIVTDSAGIPLLVLELLTAVARGFELHGAPKAWPATERTLEDSLPGDLPDSVVAALRVNFRTLSMPAQEALVAASVLREPVVPSYLACVLEAPAGAVQEALDELETQRWLASDGRGYAFVARLVRHVIREDLLTPGRRRRLRERAARCDGGGAAD